VECVVDPASYFDLRNYQISQPLRDLLGNRFTEERVELTVVYPIEQTTTDPVRLDYAGIRRIADACRSGDEFQVRIRSFELHYQSIRTVIRLSFNNVVEQLVGKWADWTARVGVDQIERLADLTSKQALSPRSV
jgi:hypothetical protein